MRFPKTPSPESLFSHPAPFSGLPAGGQFLSHSRVRSRIAFLLSKQQTFQEEDFPRGILHSPHIILGNVVSQFRPAFRLSVRCGTHDYTRFERRVNTFCKNFLVSLSGAIHPFWQKRMSRALSSILGQSAESRHNQRFGKPYI